MQVKTSGETNSSQPYFIYNLVEEDFLAESTLSFGMNRLASTIQDHLDRGTAKEPRDESLPRMD